MWLTPKASYNVDFDKMTVRIANVGELPILGHPRNLKEYMSWRMKEARLVIKVYKEEGSILYKYDFRLQVITAI